MHMAKKPWRKILYEQQAYPDNYSGPDFLDQLRKNVNAETYTFKQAVWGSCIFMQHICGVVLFVVLFANVHTSNLKLSTLFATVGCIGLALYLAKLIFYFETFGFRILFRDLKTFVLYVGFAYGLSPIFRTLTATVSTDTIYALTTVAFISNAVFADYGIDVFIVSFPLSLNAGIFGSVCLISRLSSTNAVFAVLSLSAEIFALWPLLRRELAIRAPASTLAITFTLSAVVAIGLWRLSMASCMVYVAFHIFITLVCPYWMIKMQHLKNTINGPWDEAVISN